MHKAIKLEKDFPLTFLGFDVVVSYDRNSKLYEINTRIEKEKIVISDSNPSVVESKFKEKIMNLINYIY